MADVTVIATISEKNGSTAFSVLKVLNDDDHDTKIQVEESVDEDIIRLDANSVEVAVIGSAGQWQLPVTGSAAGLLIGGDVQLYRSAANTLRTPDALIVDGLLTPSGGIDAEVPCEIVFPLADPIVASADTHLTPAYEYKNPWVSGSARRMGAWYVKFESNVGGDVTLKLQKNGTDVTGASITVSSGTSESSVDSFNEFTLADGDTLEVEQSTARTDAIQAVVYVYGYEKVVPGGDTL